MVENKNNKVNSYINPDKDELVNKKIGDNLLKWEKGLSIKN